MFLVQLLPESFINIIQIKNYFSLEHPSQGGVNVLVSATTAVKSF